MLMLMRRSLGIIVMVSVLITAGLFAPAATVQASSGKIWARWKLELDFTQGATRAVWTVAIGEYDTNMSPPAMKLIIQKAQSIECSPKGSFTIANNEAVFDGKGYLECPTPSFYHAVLALAKEYNQDLGQSFLERCTCVNPIPWITSDMTIEQSQSPNPIIHEINGGIDFYTPLAGNNDGIQQANSNLLLNGQLIGPSFSWAVKQKGNQLWSGTGVESFLVLSDPTWATFLTPAFYTTAKSTPADNFLHWENASKPLTFPSASSMSITNLATTFYIGYDGQSYFVGKIRKLAWDPGCSPH